MRTKNPYPVFIIVALLAAASLFAFAAPALAQTPAPTPTPTLNPTPGPTPSSGARLIATDDANCRSTPTSTSPVASYLLSGQSATVVSRLEDDSWWLIQSPGRYALNGQLPLASASSSTTCWVWGGSTQFQGDPSSVPVTSQPPSLKPSYQGPASPPNSNNTSNAASGSTGGRVRNIP